MFPTPLTHLYSSIAGYVTDRRSAHTAHTVNRRSASAIVYHIERRRGVPPKLSHSLMSMSPLEIRVSARRTSLFRMASQSLAILEIVTGSHFSFGGHAEENHFFYISTQKYIFNNTSKKNSPPPDTKKMSTTPITSLEAIFELVSDEGCVDGVKQALEHGLDVCGGPSRGLVALHNATRGGHVEVMRVLTDAGVRDTSCSALVVALFLGRRDAIRFLLKHYERHYKRNSISDVYGTISLMFTIIHNSPWSFSPKLVRWLIDAGVNTKVVAKPVVCGSMVFVRESDTPREVLDRLKAKHPPEQAPMLYAIDRLLHQEDAVHAKSWLWPRVEPEVEPEVEPAKKTLSTRTRWSRSKSGVVLRGLRRYNSKVDPSGCD